MASAKSIFRAAAGGWLFLGVALWAYGGFRMGWTLTEVTVMQTDPVTGIDYPVVTPAFMPGIEFPLAGALLALSCWLISLFLKTSNPHSHA